MTIYLVRDDDLCVEFVYLNENAAQRRCREMNARLLKYHPKYEVTDFETEDEPTDAQS